MGRAKCAENGTNALLEAAQFVDTNKARPQNRTKRASTEDEPATAELTIELAGCFRCDVWR
jgi:hypothetical protein